MPPMTQTGDLLSLALEGFLSGDKGVREKSTSQICDGQISIVIPFLCASLRDPAIQFDLRRLAAVLLRKVLASNFADLQNSAQYIAGQNGAAQNGAAPNLTNVSLLRSVQADVVSFLKQTFKDEEEEENSKIGFLLCDVAYQLSSLYQRAEDWTSLWELVQEKVSEWDANRVALVLVARLAALPFSFSPLSTNPNMNPYFCRALKHPHHSVRSEAIKTITACITQSREGGKMSKFLCVLSVDILKAAGNSEKVEDFLNIREIGDKSVKFWTDKTSLLTLALNLAYAPTKPLQIRLAAVNLLGSYIGNCKSPSRQDTKIFCAILTKLLELIATDEVAVKDALLFAEENGSNDDREENLSETALQAIGTIVKSQDATGKTVMDLCSNFLTSSDRPWGYYYAGLMGFTEVVQNKTCVNDSYTPVLRQALICLGYREAPVRWAALCLMRAIYQNSEVLFLIEFIGDSMEGLMRAISGDAMVRNRIEGLEALCAFLANFADEEKEDEEDEQDEISSLRAPCPSYPSLAPYVQPMLQMAIITSIRTENQKELQELGLTAATLIAQCCGREFAPYYPDFMAAAKNLISQKEEGLYETAIDLVGQLSLCVSGEEYEWGWVVKEMVQILEKGENVDSALVLLHRLLPALAHNFLIYIPFIVPPLAKLALQPENIEVTEVELNLEAKEGCDHDEATGMISMRVADASGAFHNITVNSRAAEEKTNSMGLLRQIASRFPDALGPWTSQAIQACLSDLNSKLSTYRALAYESFPAFFTCLLHLEKTNKNLEKSKAALQSFITTISAAISTRSAEELGSSILCGLQEVLESLTGPFPPVAPHHTYLSGIDFEGKIGLICFNPQERINCLTAIFPLIEQILQKTIEAEASKAAEAKEEADEWENVSDNEEEEEGGENAGLIYDGCMHAVVNLFRLYGDACADIFTQTVAKHFGALLANEDLANPLGRIAGLCTFGEAVNTGGNLSNLYGPSLLTVASLYCPSQNFFSDPDHNLMITQAAAFSLGVVADKMTLSKEDVLAITTKLEEFLQSPAASEKSGRPAVDCAVNALFKIWDKFRGEVEKMGRLEYIGEILLKWLPLKADQDEQQETHRRLLQHLQQGSALAQFLLQNHKQATQAVLNYIIKDRLSVSPMDWKLLLVVVQSLSA